MVGRPRMARQRVDQLVGQRVVFANRAQQLAATADGQARAAHDFGGMHGKQNGALHHAAQKNGAAVVDAPLPHREGLGKLPDASAPLTLTPGHAANRAHCGRHNGHGKLYAHHPVGISQVKLERRVIAIQGPGHLAQLIVALADHREVRDRIDPAAGGRLDAALAFIEKGVQRSSVVAVEIGRQRGEINPRRHAVARGDLRAGSRSARERSGEP